MGLLSKITGKKDQENKVSKDENVLDMVKETPGGAKGALQEEVKLKEDTGSAYRVLKSPHVSEKSSIFAQTGRYVFKVNDRSNKIEIRKAVEKAYDVHVVSVNIVNSKGKSRRMGRRVGRTSDWKKAIVTLKHGEKIQGLIESV